jgi:type I restriction enzyme S subunit
MQLSLDDIREFTLPCPPLDEQLSVVEYLDRATSNLDVLRSDIQTSITLLREKRSALISSAVTGEMAVP